MKHLAPVFAVAAVIIACAACSPETGADIELAAYLTDSMVVQQNSVLKVKGISKGAVRAIPSWDGKKYTARTDADGTFCIEIPTPAAGGPYSLRINNKELRDIYSGEVWLCSGQSNMEMPVKGWGRVDNYEAELDSAANYPLIRLLQIERGTATSPRDQIAVGMGGWRTPSEATVENFSAVAYFFARDLQKALGGIAVGVINSSWGGTPCEAWTSLGGVKSIGGMEKSVEMVEDYDANGETIMAQYEAELNKWQAAQDRFADSIYHSGVAPAATMPVPEMWEKSVLPDFDGVVYCQKNVEIPKSMFGKTLTVSLAAVDDNDRTYINGKFIGATEGYNKRRLYNVEPGLIVDNKVAVAVCVTDNGRGGGLWGDPKEYFLTDGSDTLSLAGRWQYAIVGGKEVIDAQPRLNLDQNSPSMLYNAMIYPLRDISLAGVLWYQGCSNVGRAEQYSRLFPLMIEQWRSLFGNDTLPFYFVQLAAYLEPRAVQPDSEWAALRQAQTAALALENTGMATAIDIGDSTDIHPKNKQEVARRLALVAMKNSYGRADIVAEAPGPLAVEFDGNAARITFDAPIHAEGSPQGFIARTVDGKWLTPVAVISEDKAITLTAPAEITAIKYDWADYPDGNLYGATGLPVVPFENFSAE